MRLLIMSFGGAMMILAALLVRIFMGKRLPAWTMPVLWQLVLLRLLIPIEITSSFSIFEILPQTNQANPVATISHPAVASAAQRAGAMAAFRHIPVLPLLWAVGMTGCCTVLVFLWASSLRCYREALPVPDENVRRWQARHPLRRRFSIRQSDRISTPLTYGIFHPVILLPVRRDWTEDEMESILTHEYVHIRHWDCLTKLLLLAACCIHWFNPLVWVMAVLANRDLELCCDAGVLRHLGQERRAQYALTLIRLEEQRTFFPSLPNYFSATPIKERIASIMKQKKYSHIAVALALVLVLSASAIFATSASAEHTSEAQGKQPEPAVTLTAEENQEIDQQTYAGQTADSYMGAAADTQVNEDSASTETALREQTEQIAEQEVKLITFDEDDIQEQAEAANEQTIDVIITDEGARLVEWAQEQAEQATAWQSSELIISVNDDSDTAAELESVAEIVSEG